jgi:hypothetical protein
MSHDDFAFEPIRGLPERLPEGEHILWQGRPQVWALARDALNLGWVAGYFAVLGLWRFATTIDQAGFGAALAGASLFAIMGLVVCAALLLVAVAQARATVYTITNRRVAMRIGAALTLTLNLPFSQIRNAALLQRRGGSGSISFETMGRTRLGFLVCWPHVRPWHWAAPRPALRAIPEAARVAALFAEAAEAQLALPQVRRAAAPAPAGAAKAAARAAQPAGGARAAAAQTPARPLPAE